MICGNKSTGSAIYSDTGLPWTIARKEDHVIDKDIDTRDEDLDEDMEDEGTETEEMFHTQTLVVGGETPVDLAKLGVSELAYIRRAIVNDMPMWTIHSAAGDPLGAAHSFDQAWAAVKQNDMEPVRVH